MRAVVYDGFGQLPELREVPAPVPDPHGVVVRVEASGLCRSDWHAWQGHDPSVSVPHVPGHELAGVVEEVGVEVTRWAPGDRVTVPFVCACGRCEQCAAGQHQVCTAQTQPGFTHWGSFADLVALGQADVNLVRLPEGLSATTAASLGCRFATAFRAVTGQGRVRAGEWLAVHGCGGVGLSAVMVGVSAGARVLAVDVSPAALVLARELGAEAVVDARTVPDVGAAVADLTGGGVHVSMDAAGTAPTCVSSVRSLRVRGRHVQVGLLAPAASTPGLPMDLVIARELTIVGSHGMAAYAYPPLLALVSAGRLDPSRLVTRRIGLDDAGAALAGMGADGRTGITVVTGG